MVAVPDRIAAQVLAKMEEAYGVHVRDCFDLIVGTSTGAIIAGAAAAGIQMEKVAELFDSHSSKVFQRRPLRWPLFQSKYASGLAQLIRETIPGLGRFQYP